MAVQGTAAEKHELHDVNEDAKAPQKSIGDNPNVVHISIGTFLKRARSGKKLRIEDIANELHIRADYLSAIEENAHQDLPEPVYVMGYIRSYASHLGLDPCEAIRLYKLEANPNPGQMNLFFPKAVERKSLPKKSILIASCVLLATLGAGWLITQKDLPKSDAIEATVTTTQPEDASVSIEPTPSLIKEQITLKATDDTWIEVKTKDDRILVSKTLKKNESYHVPSEESLLLSTGNAAGLQILVGETAVPSLGNKGETRRKIPLDGKKLLQDAPTP